MADVRMSLNDGSLTDVLDRLVDTGAVIDGNLIITLAGVDLIRLDLRALVASTETLRPRAVEASAGSVDGAPPGRRRQRARRTPVHRASTGAITSEPAGRRSSTGPQPTVTRPPAPASSTAGQGGRRGTEDSQPALAGLVVAVVDIVRQLLERQALRRMEAGSLTSDEVEHLGRSLRALEQQVAELTDVLGLHQRKKGHTTPE